jgi:uroporphyrinogen decarboxylase
VMTSRQRLLAALQRRQPDRLPVTTHHVMDSYLESNLGGASRMEFFDRYGLDPILWTVPHRPAPDAGEYSDPNQGPPGFLESTRVSHDNWRVISEPIPNPDYLTTRYRFVTPRGELGMVLQDDGKSAWVSEHLIKNKSDIELIAEFATAPKCDVDEVNRQAAEFGESGIVRGHICCFDVFGQPGTWQDACCLFGTQELIMETFDDPGWVHELLEILLSRKLTFTRSLQGAAYDLLELGGGSASSTVISPELFEQYVAPYDSRIIEAAHQAGQRIAYHLCGGIMPMLELTAAMGPDAIETFTPPEMGADTDLADAKKRIGDKVCMIGGFDQGHYFTGCTPEETRSEVLRCFEQAGGSGGYILAPSDHFFEADDNLMRAFAAAAAECVY